MKKKIIYSLLSIVLLGSALLINFQHSKKERRPTVSKILAENNHLESLPVNKHKQVKVEKIKSYLKNDILNGLSSIKDAYKTCHEKIGAELKNRHYNLNSELNLKERTEVLKILNYFERGFYYKVDFKAARIIEHTLKAMSLNELPKSLGETVLKLVSKYSKCYDEEKVKILELYIREKGELLPSEHFAQKMNLDQLRFTHLPYRALLKVQRILLRDEIQTRPEKAPLLLEYKSLAEQNIRIITHKDQFKKYQTYLENSKRLSAITEKLLVKTESSKEHKQEKNKQEKNKKVENIKGEKKTTKPNKKDPNFSLEDALVEIKGQWDKLEEEQKDEIRSSFVYIGEALAKDSEQLKEQMYSLPFNGQEYQLTKASLGIKTAFGELTDGIIHYIKKKEITNQDIKVMAVVLNEKLNEKLIESKQQQEHDNSNYDTEQIIEELIK